MQRKTLTKLHKEYIIAIQKAWHGISSNGAKGMLWHSRAVKTSTWQGACAVDMDIRLGLIKLACQLPLFLHPPTSH